MRKDCYDEFNALRTDIIQAFLARDVHTFSILLTKINILVVRLEDEISKARFSSEIEAVKRLCDETIAVVHKKNTNKNSF